MTNPLTCKAEFKHVPHHEQNGRHGEAVAKRSLSYILRELAWEAYPIDDKSVTKLITCKLTLNPSAQREVGRSVMARFSSKKNAPA